MWLVIVCQLSAERANGGRDSAVVTLISQVTKIATVVYDGAVAVALRLRVLPDTAAASVNCQHGLSQTGGQVDLVQDSTPALLSTDILCTGGATEAHHIVYYLSCFETSCNGCKLHVVDHYMIYIYKLQVFRLSFIRYCLTSHGKHFDIPVIGITRNALAVPQTTASW